MKTGIVQTLFGSHIDGYIAWGGAITCSELDTAAEDIDV
jgi:hypothetical protein